MPWRSRVDWQPNQKLHSDDLNNLAWDDRIWGGNVDGGGYTLSNVHIVEATPLAGGGGGVTSFNSRNGDVLPLGNSQDYTAAMVGAVPLTRQINTGNVAVTGLLGGSSLSTDLNLSAAVVSVFGRTGLVTLTATDISNAGGVIKTQKINTNLGSGLQGGAALAGDVTLSVLPDSAQQQIQVMSAGSPIGSPRSRLNFISGTGALVTVSEISAQNRIDVTVSSTGTGGFVDPTQIQGDLIVRGVTAPPTRLAVGAVDGQLLTVDHLAPLGIKWAAPATPANVVTTVFSRPGPTITQVTGDYTAAQITNAVDQTGSYNNPGWIASLPFTKITNVPAFMLDPTLAKGDLIVHGATTTRLMLGADGSILTADSTLAAGVKWGSVAVKSVFSRVGDIVASALDGYTVDMIAHAVPDTRVINTINTSGLTGGGNLQGNLSLSVVPDTTNQQIEIWQEGITKIGTRHALNFKSGAGVALTIVDSPPTTGNNRIDITIASSGTGGGGGMVDPTTQKGDLIVKPSPPAPPAALGIGPNGYVLTADSTVTLGMRWVQPTGGAAGSQTPWTGPIDAAANVLNNAAGIGVNIAADTTKARVYAFVNASEDGFRATSNNAAGLAAASFINNALDSISIRSYGNGYVGGLPGFQSIEASNVLALFANASEVMRLKGGRVMIGTTTDDGVNRLQVNGKVKSLTGGFVFPDNTTQLTAYTSASVPVTSVFGRTGDVVARTTAPFDYTAAQVTNAVDSSTTYNDPAWINTLAYSKITGKPTTLFLDPTTTKGDIIVRGVAAPAARMAVGATNGMVLTVDSTDATFGVKWAAPPAQSPWLTDIDGATKTLKNVGKLGVGNDATEPVVAPGYVFLTVGPQAASATGGIVTACSNVSGGGTFIGSFAFANYALSTADKRIAQIAVNTDGANNSGAIVFQTSLAGATADRMRIAANGYVGIGAAPTRGLCVGSSGTYNDTSGIVVKGPNAGLEFADTQATPQRWLLGNSAIATNDGAFQIADLNAGRQRLILFPNGDACIGYPNAGAVLSVRGDATGVYPQLRISPTGGASSPTSKASYVDFYSTFGGGTGDQGPRRTACIKAQFAGGTWGTEALAFHVSNASDPGNEPTERMRIIASGAVGIGTVPSATATLELACNTGGGLYPALLLRGNHSDVCINLQNTGTGGHNWRIGSTSGGSGYGQGNFCIIDEAYGAWMGIDVNGISTFAGRIRCGANAYTAQQGDLGVSRTAAPNQGVVYFGNAGNQYIYFDGGTFNFTAGINIPNTSFLTNHFIMTGRIGLGVPTNPPTYKLHVYGACQNSVPYYWPGSSAECDMYMQDSAGAGGSGGAIMFGASQGPFATIKGYMTNGSGPQGDIVIYARPTAGDSAFYERVRFRNNGDVDIAGQFKVNGVVYAGAGISYQFNNGAGAGPYTYLNLIPTGSIVPQDLGASGNTKIIAWNTVSDIQVKRNVQTLTGGLPQIMQLRPITAEWNGLSNTREGEKLTSVIAQEVKEVIPEAVYSYRAVLRPGDEELTELLGLDQLAITCHLILAIQQLERRLKALEPKVN